jgi:geranylgeranyl transferase type-2 subunit alpha
VEWEWWNGSGGMEVVEWFINYQHSVKKVKNSAEQLARKKRIEAGQIREYRHLVEQYLQWRKDDKYDLDALELTTQLLSLNPEWYSVWNYRREIFIRGLFVDKPETKQDLLTRDLRFLEGCLRESPKVYWIWNHRKWCLENSPDPAWTRELGLVSKMLELDPRNFHGWHYRRYIVSHIEMATNTSMVEAEFNYTTTKINANFSNFSAWHNRAKLIPLHLKDDSPEKRRQFLKKELEYVTQALYTDPDDQSAWLYHQWLVSTDDVVVDLSSEERVRIIGEELESIKELYDLEPNSKWCCHALFYLEKYLHEEKKEPINDTQRQEMIEILEKLIHIDPMRKSRYQYLKTTLGTNS